MVLYSVFITIFTIVSYFRNKIYRDFHKRYFILIGLKKHLRKNIGIGMPVIFEFNVSRNEILIFNYNVCEYFKDRGIKGVYKKYIKVIIIFDNNCYVVKDVKMSYSEDVNIERLYTAGEAIEIKAEIKKDIQTLIDSYKPSK